MTTMNGQITGLSSQLDDKMPKLDYLVPAAKGAGTEQWTGLWWRVTGQPARKIYRKTINCGKGPTAAGSLGVAHGVPDLDRAVSAMGMIWVDSTTYGSSPLPYLNGGAAFNLSIVISVNRSEVVLLCGADRSSFNPIFVTIDYICLTR